MIQTSISPDLLASLKERARSFEHVVMVMNAPNKNGRTYPTSVVADALSRVTFPIFGCFMEDLNQGYIPLDKVTHKVLDMRIDGDRVVARIVILEDLTHGKVLKSLTNVLGEHDYRTAGSCMVDPNTGVVSGFNLISVGALAPGSGA